ncbi:unnamed protein product, partial [Gulo gulo]
YAPGVSAAGYSPLHALGLGPTEGLWTSPSGHTAAQLAPPGEEFEANSGGLPLERELWGRWLGVGAVLRVVSEEWE